MVARRSVSARSGAQQRRGLLAVCAASVAAATMSSFAFEAFASAAVRAPNSRGDVTAYAEAAPAPAPAPSTSVSLVKVSEDNKLTAVSVLGGLAGLWVGGIWIGAAAFIAATYLARSDKDSDVSKALQGISGAGLQVLNFGAEIENKNEITKKLSDIVDETLEGAKEKPGQKELAEAVSTFLKSAGGAVKAVDEDIGIKNTAGNVLTSASEMAYTATDTVTQLNDKYKVTDKIKEAIDEATSKVTKK